VPIRYEVNTSAGFVHVEAHGNVGVREVLDHLEILAADSAITPGMPVLIDVRGLARAPSLEEGEAMTRGYGSGKGRFAGSRRAFLVQSAVMFGAFRQFAVSAQRWGIRVQPFLDEAAAVQWLLEADSAE
jgi:hypothetical protein